MRTKQEVNAKRAQIAQLWAQGLTISQIARELNVSRPTVYKVVNRLDDPEASIYDGRANNGRPPIYQSETIEVIKAIRAQHPEWRPIFIRDYIIRNNLLQKVPSLREVANLINELGLARKKIGPKDTRTFPIDKINAPGTITLDLWGPWHIRAGRLYLITCQDRHTRLSVAVPTNFLKFSRESQPGVHENLWCTAIMSHYIFHCPTGTLRRIFTDNGVGMVPVFGSLPYPVLLAFFIGARVCYIPPGQPWRNGRLERFHWTMTREYWAIQKPKSFEEAERGLVDYLNWYNHQRIHSSLGYNAPIQTLCTEEYKVPLLPYDYWKEAASSVPPKSALLEAGLSGTIECIRLVENEGLVKLWQGDLLLLPSVLAGQYVRLEFDTKVGQPSFGRAIWRGKEEIVVAEFAHRLGCAGDSKSPLIYDVRWRDFGEPPRNEAYDPLEYEYGYAKRHYTKRPKRSE